MAEQKSRLVIEFSTENAKRNAEALSRETQKLTEKGDKASASFSAFSKELKTTGESAKTLGDSTSKATKELAQQESQLNKNGTAVVQLAKYVASYLTISKAISMADGYTQMAARIKNATANAQEYALVQERLYQTANTTYRSLAEAQEVYLSMSGGMKSLGYNTAQTLDMTDSLSFAFTANATRADQAQSAMDALSKSMAKGKVDADAWISIVTGADNIIADMAKTTGKSEAAIRQLGAEGKISLSDLIKTLIQTKDANEALANNMENSFADGMQKLFNATQKFLGELNKSTGATSNLAAGLGFLADHVDTVAIAGGVVASIYAGRVAAAFVLSAQKAAWNTAAMVTQTTAMNTAAVSARSLYLALGGPVGLTIGIVGTIASIYSLRDSTKVATTALDIQGQSVEELTAKYAELDELQRRTTMRELESELKELSTTFVSASSDLSSYLGWLEDSGSISEKTARKINILYKDYSKGKISASEFSTSINQLTGVQQAHKDKIDDLTTAQSKSKVEYERAKQAQDALTKQTSNAITANNKEAESIDAKRVAQEKLTKTLRMEANKSLLDNQYWINTYNATLKTTGNKKTASNFSDFAMSWRKDNNIERDVRLTKEQSKILNELWAKEQERDKLRSDANKSEQERTKELKEQLKTLQLSAQVQANAAKYNFSKYEKMYGLQAGDLTAIHAIETGNSGKTNQVNKTTGASGGFQFMPETAKRFGISGQTFDLEKSAEAAAKYLSFLYKKFNGNTEKAIRAYHAGEGNVEKGKNLGKYNNDYIRKYYAYKGGMDGFSGDAKDYESYLAEKRQLELKTQQEIDQLKSEYLTADYRRQQDHEKKVADLKAHGLNDLVAKENAQYKAETELSKLQFESQVYGWQWVGEEKIKNDAKVNKAVIDASKELGDAQKAEQKKSIDAQAEYELAVFRETQRQKINELAFAVGGAGDQARNYLMERSNPSLYARNQLSSEQFGAQSQLNKDYQSQRGEIFNQGLDPEEQHAKLLEAEKQFLDSKQALNEMYAQKETDLQQSQYESQLQMWGTLVNQAQSTWGMMTQSVKDANGEQSSEYKTMFAMQQAFAIASAVISTEEAASKALTMGPVLGIPMSTLVRTMGYANVAMIAAQTIAGFSEGGYTGSGGKYEPAGVVHKGEVVFSQADIARLGGVGVVEALRKGQRGYSDGGVVGNSYTPKAIEKLNGKSTGEESIQISQTIVVNTDGSAKVDTQGQKQLAQGFQTMMESYTRKQMRQGGLIYNFVRGQ